MNLPRRSLRIVSPPRSPTERHRVVSVTTRTTSEAERQQVRSWYDAYLEEHFPQFDRANEIEEDLRWSQEQWNRAQPMQPTSTVRMNREDAAEQRERRRREQTDAEDQGYPLVPRYDMVDEEEEEEATSGGIHRHYESSEEPEEEQRFSRLTDDEDEENLSPQHFKSSERIRDTHLHVDGVTSVTRHQVQKWTMTNIVEKTRLLFRNPQA